MDSGKAFGKKLEGAAEAEARAHCYERKPSVFANRTEDETGKVGGGWSEEKLRKEKKGKKKTSGHSVSRRKREAPSAPR